MNAHTPNGPILVGMDFSKPSRVALEEAVFIASSRDAAIVLLYALPPGFASDYAWLSPSSVARFMDISEKRLGECREELRELAASHRDCGVDITIALVRDDPEHALVTAAQDRDAQLIVVGTHDRDGLDHLLLGSVSERLSRHTDRDVLVSRRPPDGGYQRVLVATDFSPTSARALEVAQDLVARDGRITLLHACSIPPEMAGYYTGDVLDAIEKQSTEKSEALARPVRERGHAVDVVTKGGAAAKVIVELSTEHDLVVMGSHGRRGLVRYLLGSVSEKVIRHARCSIYVARATEST